MKMNPLKKLKSVLGDYGDIIHSGAVDAEEFFIFMQEFTESPFFDYNETKIEFSNERIRIIDILEAEIISRRLSVYNGIRNTKDGQEMIQTITNELGRLSDEFINSYKVFLKEIDRVTQEVLDYLDLGELKSSQVYLQVGIEQQYWSSLAIERSVGSTVRFYRGNGPIFIEISNQKLNSEQLKKLDKAGWVLKTNMNQRVRDWFWEE